jgi:hypothetical protein
MNSNIVSLLYRLCGLVGTVLDYTVIGPGFESRRYHFWGRCSGSGSGPLSLLRITEGLFERKHLIPANVGTSFADKWRPLGPYISLAD